MGANTHFLSLRLSTEDSRIVERLHGQLGLSKSEVVKKALRLLAYRTKQQNKPAYSIKMERYLLQEQHLVRPAQNFLFVSVISRHIIMVELQILMGRGLQRLEKL